MDVQDDDMYSSSDDGGVPLGRSPGPSIELAIRTEQSEGQLALLEPPMYYPIEPGSAPSSMQSRIAQDYQLSLTRTLNFKDLSGNMEIASRTEQHEIQAHSPYFQNPAIFAVPGAQLWRLPVEPVNENSSGPAGNVYQKSCRLIHQNWRCEPAEGLPDLLHDSTPYSLVLLLQLRMLSSYSKKNRLHAHSILVEQWRARTSRLNIQPDIHGRSIYDSEVTTGANKRCLTQCEQHISENQFGLTLEDVAIAIEEAKGHRRQMKIDLAMKPQRTPRPLADYPTPQSDEHFGRQPLTTETLKQIEMSDNPYPHPPASQVVADYPLHQPHERFGPINNRKLERIEMIRRKEEKYPHSRKIKLSKQEKRMLIAHKAQEKETRQKMCSGETPVRRSQRLARLQAAPTGLYRRIDDVSHPGLPGDMDGLTGASDPSVEPILHYSGQGGSQRSVVAGTSYENVSPADLHEYRMMQQMMSSNLRIEEARARVGKRRAKREKTLQRLADTGVRKASELSNLPSERMDFSTLPSLNARLGTVEEGEMADALKGLGLELAEIGQQPLPSALPEATSYNISADDTKWFRR